jgi:hypothetical protein
MLERETKEIVLPISQKKVVIREGDGYSYRALIKRNKRIFESIYDYMASMVVSIDGKENINRENVLKLLLPDQEYLSIEIYRICYGDVFEFQFTCPACGKTNEQEFPLDKLEFMPLKEGLTGPDPIINITLPRSKKTAIVGMLTGEKELELLQQAITTGMDLNQGDYKALRSFDGGVDFSYEDILKLPLADHKAIRKARNKLICGYDPTAIVTCPNCEEQASVNILMHSDFLLPAG